MLIRWAVWLTSLVLFSGVFCDTPEKFFSGNLNKQNLFLEDEYAGPESQVAVQRVLRATPTGWMSISTSSLNIIKGESDSVTCSSDTNDLVWLDSMNKKLKPSDSIKIDTDKKGNKTKLTFSPVKTKHSGRYFCVNQNSNRSANFTLTVYEKPKPKITYSSKSYVVGDNFDLICEGNSPNISWATSLGNPIISNSMGKNLVFTGKVMNGTKGKSSLALSFRNASMAQSGEYKCSVKVLNKVDSDSVSIKVSPTVLYFSPEKEDKSVKENDDFSIKCSGRVSQIWWAHNGKSIGSNHPGDENIYVEKKKHDEQTLNFENVEKFNEGQYICYGYSTFNGQLLQKSFKLKVIEDNFLGNPIIRSRKPPMSNKVAKVTIHTNFTAVCIGETADVQWLGPPNYWNIPAHTVIETNIYTEHIPKFQKKLLLRFRNVTLNDEGRYICQVKKKDLQPKIAEFNLTVIIPIEFNNTPSIYTANETSDIKLECAVNGKPKPEVLWYRHDKPIINETGISYDGNSLVLKNISYRNAGKYICLAKQSSIEGSTREKAVALHVLHKPYFSKANVTIERLKKQTSSIKCHADANPPARYTWYRNDSFVITASGSPASNLENGTIELPLLHNTEYEIFTCNASNSYGSSVQMVNVTVMQIPPVPIVRLLIASKNEIKYQIIANRNESITDFVVEYREKSSSEWNEKNETKADSYLHAYVLDELHPKTEYLIRARSVNPVGVSEFSKEEAVKTSVANQLTASIGVLFAVILTLNNFEFL